MVYTMVNWIIHLTSMWKIHIADGVATHIYVSLLTKKFSVTDQTRIDQRGGVLKSIFNVFFVFYFILFYF